MTAKIVELETSAVKSRKSVAKCMEAMVERHEAGEIENLASVYWLKDGTVRLYITDGMTLANLAYAIKALDMELTALMGPGA